MTKLFDTGAQFPPAADIERLAKYQRGRAIFDNKQYEIAQRMTDILKDTEFAPQLNKLLICVGLADILCSKPADLLIGEPPVYETGKPDSEPVQKALNRIVEENDINAMIHEATISNAYLGDMFVKTYYNYRQDFSEVAALVGEEFTIPTPAEAIIEPVDPSLVFPETVRGSKKRFKAVNIAWVEVVETDNGVIATAFTRLAKKTEYFLNIERHLPGYIVYERYKMTPKGVDTSYDAPIPTYLIGDKVSTGRDVDVVITGVPDILVKHIPYKSVIDRWQGISDVEKLESLFAAINDRLVMIDYILHKNGHPTAYGPDLDENEVKIGGAYIPITKEDATPGYMKLDGALDSAFRELETLLTLAFQLSETPDWIFGTSIKQSGNAAGGTSHTTSGGIKARFFPLLSKVKRIRAHVDKAIRDSLYNAMRLENYANEGVDGFTPYEPEYPSIIWKDGIPRDEKEEAEIAQIRTGGKATQSVQDAIKKLDNVGDMQAKESIKRIDADETRVNGTVDASIFNAPGGDN
ncbi:phage portal protein [Aneurinibacillus aneurinilyticus]|uniref:portal protein n=1 Tax=Aneurinibacillus aneurinilyticus TaxID=1391 RepID=UPI003670E86A